MDLKNSLGLPEAYNDIFDRITNRRDAWVVATGHLLLHALEDAAARDSTGMLDEAAGRGVGAGDKEGRDGHYEQLLKNCLRPAW